MENERKYLFAVNDIAKMLVEKFTIDVEMQQGGQGIDCAIVAVNLLIENLTDEDKITLYKDVIRFLRKMK